MDTIVPSADLRNSYNKMSKKCKETREPVYITVNGKGDTVLLDITQYNLLQAELELYKLISEGEHDIANNKTVSFDDGFTNIRKKLEAMRGDDKNR